MKPSERLTVIRQRLEKAFSPSKLEIIDDSDKHVGHAGSQNGAGHYTVIIAAESLKQQTLVNGHREIYNILSDLIPNEIHALQIKIQK